MIFRGIFSLAFAAAAAVSTLNSPASAAALAASDWRPTPAQLGAGIQFHLDGIAPFLPAGTDIKIDGPALTGTLRDRIAAADASRDEVYAGLVLMQALGRPERAVGVESYLESAGPTQRAVVEGMSRWSSLLQRNPAAQRSLLNALQQTKQALTNSGSFDLEAAAGLDSLLFDGGRGLASGAPAVFAGNGTKGAPASSRLRRAGRLSPEALLNIREKIGSIKESEAAVTQVDYPLYTAETADVIYLQMRSDLENRRGMSDGFFSQLRIDPDGRLHAIRDPTVQKDLGEDIAVAWNTPRLRSAFQEIYEAAQGLEKAMKSALPGDHLRLSEVVFTYQTRKRSESWHLDWYPNEDVVATQTFIAKRRAPDGRLEDEKLGGTEYLLHADGGAGMKSARISFNVNKPVVERIDAVGVEQRMPTGALTIHSGTNRVERMLGHKDLDLISPPHRGSFAPMEFRGSVAVRFESDRFSR